MVRTRRFHCRGPGSIPGWGTKIPQVARRAGEDFHRHENILRVREWRDLDHQYFLNAIKIKVISVDLINTRPKFVGD